MQKHFQANFIHFYVLRINQVAANFETSCSINEDVHLKLEAVIMTTVHQSVSSAVQSKTTRFVQQKHYKVVLQLDV